MAYTVREMTDSAAFERLVAFQENSAHEVSHRRDHAGHPSGADAERAVSRFRSSAQSRHRRPKDPPLIS